MKLSIKDFFSECDEFRCFADLVKSTEEILNEKLHFLCSVLEKIGKGKAQKSFKTSCIEQIC